MKTFNLIDTVFTHDVCTVAGRNSEHILWDTKLLDENNKYMYSHEKMLENDKKDAYGLIFESRAIIPLIYHRVEKRISLFKEVYTHNSEFLKKYSNCKWIPGGGIWIGGYYGGGEIKIKEKTKLCSLVSSGKIMCRLHQFRLNIYETVNRDIVDVFGVYKHIQINKSLEDYMFSIIVENYVDDLYFTEKILNCFATGTIPIYLGARNIGEKFNVEGIITFKTQEELHNLLPTLNKELYLSKMGAIQDNFIKCQEYKCIEDYIYNNYLLNNLQNNSKVVEIIV